MVTTCQALSRVPQLNRHRRGRRCVTPPKRQSEGGSVGEVRYGSDEAGGGAEGRFILPIRSSTSFSQSSRGWVTEGSGGPWSSGGCPSRAIAEGDRFRLRISGSTLMRLTMVTLG